MKIAWSEDAQRAVRERLGEAAEGAVLKLAYDNEGCGCAVNGVPALWVIDAPGADDVRADSEPFAVWYDRHHQVYFEESLRVSYHAGYRAFALSSDSQYYTNRLPLTDRRSAVGQS